VKTKIGNLVNAQMALGQLMNEPLPAQTAFQLARIAKAYEGEMKTYEEARVALCKKYGELNATTNQFDFAPGQREPFDKEMIELFDVEIELPGKKLGFHAISSAKISPRDWLLLEWLIDDPPEAKP
jgi:hypothetical protein